MIAGRFPLRVWPGRWAVCRLPPASAVPAWALAPSPLGVIARTAAELSVVAREPDVPAEVSGRRGFRVIEVVGPVPFEVTGLMAALARPLAEAGISLFAVATHDTDYVLVQEAALPGAVDALRGAGFEVT
jgi:hypothetical protein